MGPAHEALTHQQEALCDDDVADTWRSCFKSAAFSLTASHAPYKWDYWPHDDVRAECRFVGLTNLGATCYLASTIQQLYMIPEARQAVFTAKVSVGLS